MIRNRRGHDAVKNYLKIYIFWFVNPRRLHRRRISIIFFCNQSNKNHKSSIISVLLCKCLYRSSLKESKITDSDLPLMISDVKYGGCKRY